MGDSDEDVVVKGYNINEEDWGFIMMNETLGV